MFTIEPRQRNDDQSPHRPGRSSVTCLYRCGNACAQEAPNCSGNEYFGDMMRSAVSRRGVLRAGAVVGVAGLVAPALSGGPAAAAPRSKAPSKGFAPGLGFSTVPPNVIDDVVVPTGYDKKVVIAWGDPVLKGAPAFDVHAQTAAAQRRQFGFNNDFLGLLP